MNLVRYLILSIGLYLNSTSCCLMVQAQAVGNGSSIAPSDSKSDAYGINSTSTPGSSFTSRHTPIEAFSGIGESFLQTTSPTRESRRASPAQSALAAPQVTVKQFKLPKLESAFPQFRLTPALESPPSVSPAIPRTLNRGSLTGVQGTNTRPLQSVEELPSFSNRPSALQKMDIDQIDKVLP